MEPDPNKRQEFGPIVGIIIIVSLLVVGGIYFFWVQQERIGDSNEQAVETNP